MSFQEPLALSFLPHNVGKYYATYEVGFFKPLHVLSFICYLLGFLKLKKNSYSEHGWQVSGALMLICIYNKIMTMMKVYHQLQVILAQLASSIQKQQYTGI